MSQSSQPMFEPETLDVNPNPTEADPPALGAEGNVYQVSALYPENVLHETSSAFGSHPALNGKDEMNLAEFPIARLGRSDTRLTIEYKGQITDKLGNVVEQRWLVSGNVTFGLPTEFADRVLVALMFITSKENLKDKYPDRRVPFTTYRILKLLGLSLNQRNYAAVEKALQQLVGVTIYSEGAFWDHEHQKRVTTKKGFHILEEFWLKSFDEDDEQPLDNERTTAAGDTESNAADDLMPGKVLAAGSRASMTGYIVWGERIWDSFQAGYIKNLDVEFYYALENTLARRLYRFLDKRMHYQNTYQIDIFDLAARMGMKPYPYASHVARKLKPAFDELRSQGYLASAELIKVGNYTRVRFVRASEKLAEESTTRAIDNLTEGIIENFAGSQRGLTSPQNSTAGRNEAITLAQVQTHTRSVKTSPRADFEPSSQCLSLWTSLLAEYQRTLPPATYAMLANSQLVKLEQSVAIIAVESRYQEWIARQMVHQIKMRLNHALEAEQRVREVKIIAH